MAYFVGWFEAPASCPAGSPGGLRRFHGQVLNCRAGVRSAGGPRVVGVVLSGPLREVPRLRICSSRRTGRRLASPCRMLMPVVIAVAGPDASVRRHRLERSTVQV